MNKTILLLFLIIGFNTFSQENCFNGIDDNGNGLIDLNDPECFCNPLSNTSIIPNPSFENYSSLPNNISQLNLAIPWVQATLPTTDYFHTSGYIPFGTNALGLLPFPNGNAAVGGFFINGWREYLGSVLMNPMLSGNVYEIRFNIAAVRADPNVNIDNINLITALPATTVAIYGSNSLPNFPLQTNNAPTTIFNSQWVVLGQVTYSPQSSWSELTISFTPTVDINAIMLGPPEFLPNQYNWSSNFRAPYFLYDNLRLNTSLSFGATINSSGDFCDNNLILTASPNSSSLNYQWYLNGIAILGATSSTYNVPFASNNIGEYRVRIYNNSECDNSQPFNISDVILAPTFTQIPPICSGESLLPLPTTSNNGILGNWTPELNNTQTTTYTFTPLNNQCATTQTMTIVVNPIEAPLFTQVAPICDGDKLLPLPTTSNNGIIGTWLPQLNNNETTTYTFTPTSGQCSSLQQTMTIVVNPNITPNFTQVDPICFGGAMSALPSMSNNGITGSWSPALNNTLTTTYTFTPDSGQCATTQTMTIMVNPFVTPLFNQIADVCSGQNFSLPTTSLNNINGTWSPAINNFQTTTYTFTPNPGQCGNTQTMTVVVIPRIAPIFDPIPQLCYDSSFVLPTTSNNGISGTWSPEFDNTVSGTYVFTPLTSCDLPVTVNVSIRSDFDFDFVQYCRNENFILELININQSINLSNANYYWFFETNIIPNNNNFKLDVTNYFNSTPENEQPPYTISVNVINEFGCEKIKSIVVDNDYCRIQQGISPNGDNLNDFFDLRLLNVNHLMIYNRWGIKVYDKYDYKDEWKGQTNDGKILPDGTYFYIINFKDNLPSKAGWIYISKEVR